MGAESKIQWTHHTYNPWWGCEKVSPACKNCYAEAFAKRTGHAVWGGDTSPRRFFGDAHWAEPLKWNRAAEKAGERHRVFCASMADVFEARDDLDAHRARLWDLIDATPALDWLLVTKRPEEIMKRTPERWRRKLPANIWCGTTVENQEMANERIPHLLDVPARVRFLSCEPLLGPLNLDPATCPTCDGHEAVTGEDGMPYCPEHEDEMCFGAWLDPCADERQQGINWVIIGGESGGNARAFDLAAAREVIRQCQDREVATFVKQLGALPTTDDDDDRRFVGNMMIHGRFRLRLLDRSGGDPGEWPHDLDVRQFPEVTP
jgi:protein gp37